MKLPADLLGAPAGTADFVGGRVGAIVGLLLALLYTLKGTAAGMTGVINATAKNTPAMAFCAQFILCSTFSPAHRARVRDSAHEALSRLAETPLDHCALL